MIARSSRLALALAAVALRPAAAPAQTVVGFAGFSYQRGEPDFHRGPHLGVALSFAPGSGVGARLDFGYHAIDYSKFCPIPEGCAAPGSTGDALHVIAATASIVLAPQPKGRAGVFATAGAGVYAATESPNDGPYARPGFHLGLGVRFGPSIFVEARYIEMIRPLTVRRLVPITLGVRL
jgi:hypothetical protein